MESSRLRIASWNVECGVFSSGQVAASEPLEPDLPYIIDCIVHLHADVVCLQEVLFPSGGKPTHSSLISGATGLNHVEELELSPSSIVGDSKMGLAILSRHPLRDIRRVQLPNPRLSVKKEDGQLIESHDKGLLIATVEWPEGAFVVACGHFLPFHLFRRDAREAEFEPLHSKVKEELQKISAGPTLVCADFNTNDLSILLPDNGAQESLFKLVQAPTRPSGDSHDNILCSRHWSEEGIFLIPTRSDHHICLADLKLSLEYEQSGSYSFPGRSVTTILHISDLHLGPGEIVDDDWKTPISYTTQKSRGDRFVQMAGYLPAMPDFVVVSGDITTAGDEKGFERFNEIIDKLIEAKKLPSVDRFIVVPGNHDVTRLQEDDDDREASRWTNFIKQVGGRHVRPWIPSADKTSADLLALASHSIQPDSPVWGGVRHSFNQRLGKEMIDCFPFILDREHKVFFYAFNSASISGTTLKLEAEVKKSVEWLREYEDLNKKKIEPVLGALNRKMRVDPARIAPEELDLFTKIVKLLNERDPDNFRNVLKIAVLHHHVSPIVSVEEIKEFELLLNAGRFKYQLQQAGFHLILHGHKHWPEVFLDTAITEGGAHLVISGGTIAGAEAPGKSPGFFWIQHQKAENTISARYIKLGKAGEDPGVDFQSEALRFQVPTPKQMLGIVPPSHATPEGLRLNLRNIHHDAEIGLLDHLRTQPGAGNKTYRGWMHRLNEPYVSLIATAYGLLIMRMVESRDPRFLKHRSNIIDFLLDMRLPDGGWSASSQGNSGRPEATAWTIAALHEWGRESEADLGLKALERMFDEKTDPVSMKFIFTICLALRVVSRVNPASPLLSKLSKALIDSSARDRNNMVRYWSMYSFSKESKWSPKAEPSVLHTAHAMIALISAHRASSGKSGLPPEKVAAARGWLLEQPEWANTREIIRRSTSPGKYESLIINHYTAPWVVIALLESGAAPSEPRIESAIMNIARSSNNGLWSWETDPLPIWATYDALKVLTEFVFRGGSV